MNQEELEALMQSHQNKWDEELQSQEAMPQFINNEEQQNDTYQEARTLQSIIEDSQNGIQVAQNELEDMKNKSKEINQNIQEVLNYAIRHLEVFEKLAHKFPNIKVFDNSFHETQDIIEKIIAIQNNAKKCSQHCIEIQNTISTEQKYHAKINHIVDTTRALSDYLNHLFNQPFEESKLPIFSKKENEEHEEIHFDDEIQAIITSFGAKK